MLIHISIIRHTASRRIEASIHSQEIRSQTRKDLRGQHHNVFLTDQLSRSQDSKAISQAISKVINKAGTVRSRQLTIGH